MKTEIETWKDIPGYEGKYLINEFGTVKSLITNKILARTIGKIGYYVVVLRKDNKSKMFTTHRLVAKTFIPNPENKPQVNHINGIKSDSHVSNLEWVTCKENVNHAWKTKLATKEKYMKKVIDTQTGVIYPSVKTAAKELNLNKNTLSHYLRGYLPNKTNLKFYKNNLKK